jgi:2Fe-2S ferredoxin|tara:strand:- start:6182 stop:6511 length:330 start_codon:yes stop_codon:yes gene_type:complete
VKSNLEKVDIIFIESSGVEKTVSASVGVSLMSVAKDNMIEGIDADCGGCCACGTCRIYAETNIDRLFPDPDEMESAMLEFAADDGSAQRLSCQLEVGAAFSGLRVRVVV